jgi:probable phosphoglycerate mutase
MAVELIIVRHGRTAWNKEVRFRGAVDIPLDEVGLSQAQAVALTVRTRWPEAVALYSSPLPRAMQTATPIAASYNLPIQNHLGLNDLSYGDWTGCTPAEVESRDPQLYQLWLTRPQDVRFSSGDSLAQMQERQVHMLQEIQGAHDGQRVILVSHQLVIRVLLCTLLDIGLEKIRRLGQDTAAINLARYRKGRGSVVTMNDTCHLTAIGIEGGTDV